jgi:UDPglucose 6-dehydrogenase
MFYSNKFKERSSRGQLFASLLQSCAAIADVPVLLCDSTEVEAIKIFGNTYLALLN